MNNKTQYLCYAAMAVGLAVVVAAAKTWHDAAECSSAEQEQPQPYSELRNCGVECAAYLAINRSIAQSPEVIREKAKAYLEKDGTITLKNLHQLCADIGLGTGRALRVDMEDLPQMPLPFIAHLDFGTTKHFVVCLDMREKHIMVYSPTSVHPAMNMPMDLFKKRFTGAVLVFAPGNEAADVLKSVK